MHNPEFEIEAAKQAEQEKIQELLSRSGMRVEKIAELLGAEAYLTSMRGGVRFDVKRYIEDTVRSRGIHFLRLPEVIGHIPDVVLPPGEGEIRVGSGAGIEQKEIIHRTKYLIEVLTDLKILYIVQSSDVTPEMMRGTGYFVFFLPDRHKTILINNEEGNATFVIFSTATIAEALSLITSFTKDDLRSIHSDRVQAISWINDSEVWKAQMASLILQEKPKQTSEQSGSDIETPDAQPDRTYWTPEIAIRTLIKAHSQWRDNGKQGKFNVKWLQKNGYLGLYQWAYRHDGIDALVKQAPEEIQADFEKRFRREN